MRSVLMALSVSLALAATAGWYALHEHAPTGAAYRVIDDANTD